MENLSFVVGRDYCNLKTTAVETNSFLIFFIKAIIKSITA